MTIDQSLGEAYENGGSECRLRFFGGHQPILQIQKASAQLLVLLHQLLHLSLRSRFRPIRRKRRANHDETTSPPSSQARIHALTQHRSQQMPHSLPAADSAAQLEQVHRQSTPPLWRTTLLAASGATTARVLTTDSHSLLLPGEALLPC